MRSRGIRQARSRVLWILGALLALTSCTARPRPAQAEPPDDQASSEPVVFVEAPSDPSAARAPTTSDPGPAVSREDLPSEAELEQAKLLFMEGQARYEQHDFAGALDYFEQAYARVRKPALAYNIAHCLEQLGRTNDACRVYLELRDAPGGELRDAADQAIARLGC